MARSVTGTQSWMNELGSVHAVSEEPVIQEVQKLKFGFGAGATVLDPWKERHNREAARLAARWAVETKRCTENQELPAACQEGKPRAEGTS